MPLYKFTCMAYCTVDIYMNGLLYCGVQILTNCRVSSRIETDRKLKETGQQIENILIFFKT